MAGIFRYLSWRPEHLSGWADARRVACCVAAPGACLARCIGWYRGISSLRNSLPVCSFLASALQMLASTLARAAAWTGRTHSPRARALPHARVLMARVTSGASAHLEATVLSTLREKCSVDDRASLLLCVSGGSDSVAMLHILAKLREERLPDLKLSVLHFNHKLRPESDQELAFVRALAEQHGMPFFSREWEHGVQPASQSHFEDLQNRAREWRRAESMAILDSEPLNDGAHQSTPGCLGIPARLACADTIHVRV